MLYIPQCPVGNRTGLPGCGQYYKPQDMVESVDNSHLSFVAVTHLDGENLIFTKFLLFHYTEGSGWNGGHFSCQVYDS